MEYDTPENHWFGTTVAGILREKHSILVSGKWHRLGFSPALIVDSDTCNYVGNLVCDVFEDVASNFDLYKQTVKFDQSVF